MVAGVLAQDMESWGPRDDLEDPPKWQEAETVIPPYPDRDNLLSFPVAVTGTSYEFFIDGKSISVGRDGIVRYTAVVRSRSGAENVLFEGINCLGGEYKTYAYGQLKKVFRRLKAPQWQDLTTGGVMAYRDEVYRQYFCFGYGSPRSLEDILSRLKAANQVDFQGYDGDF